jgi:hypothetical protein
MKGTHEAHLACERCYGPMNFVEAVPVLQSLDGHAVFDCQWCGNVALVRKEEPLRTASWIGSLPADRRVSFAAL